MDIKKSNVDEQMEELRQALKDINLEPKDLEINNSGAVGGSYGYESVDDAVTLNGSSLYNNTVVGGGYSYPSFTGPSGTITTGAGAYTLNLSGAGTGLNYNNSTITTNPSWWGTNAATNVSGMLQLNGENADIEINGVSLMDLLRDRLNIMIPNPELEKEWDELKELGEKYRAAEKKLKEQSEMWKKLKQNPPDSLY